MDILVYGAGVIGSVYAARLQQAGYNVSLLARGQRAVSLRTHGIQLENASTGKKTTTQVSVVEQLAPTDRYDVVIVTVRLDQLHSVLADPCRQSSDSHPAVSAQQSGWHAAI